MSTAASAEGVRGGARTAPVPGRAPLPVAGHLDQVDLFRITTFAAVVVVHTVGTGSASSTSAAGAVEIVFHYTREAFFFLTGFVLAHSQRDRLPRLRRFWPRRIALVGIPYLVWSAVYSVRDWQLSGSRHGVAGLWHTTWHATLTGQAWFHLYFLLVSIQIYLVWPLLARLRRAGTSRPLVLVGATLALDLVLTGLAHVRTPHGALGRFWTGHGYLTVLPYLFWVVVGAVAAWHLPRVQHWVTGHRAAVLLGAAGALAAAEAVYALQLSQGWEGPAAADPVQPVFLLWGSGAIAAQYLLALAWVGRRRPGSRATRAVLWGSSASFGIYLVHPLVLEALDVLGLNGEAPWAPHQPVAGLVTWAVALGVTCLLVAVVRRTPLSMPLTGRPYRRRIHDAAAPVAGVPAASVPTGDPPQVAAESRETTAGVETAGVETAGVETAGVETAAAGGRR